MQAYLFIHHYCFSTRSRVSSGPRLDGFGATRILFMTIMKPVSTCLTHARIVVGIGRRFMIRSIDTIIILNAAQTAKRTRRIIYAVRRGVYRSGNRRRRRRRRRRKRDAGGRNERRRETMTDWPAEDECVRGLECRIPFLTITRRPVMQRRLVFASPKLTLSAALSC